ncbi:FtsX-like permease family protein [Nocardiopsis sp. NPDC058631]|uniref:FtsX-like permease family protein n=1 Tax=Nocardiopsis sp. NPDC058631 TaxID=3346566 RepID=UPI0036492F0B
MRAPPTARWRAALRLARRDALRHRGSTLLVAVVIALVVGGALAADVLLRSSTPSPETFNRMMLGEAAQARITWQMPGVVTQSPREDVVLASSDSQEKPSRDVYEDRLLALLPPGSELVGAASGAVRASAGDRATGALEALEAATDGPLAGMFVPVWGRGAAEPGEVAVSLGLARRLDLAEGSELELTDGAKGSASVTVVGAYRATRHPADLVLAPGTLVDTGGDLDSPTASAVWFVTGETPITWDDVLRINEAGSSVVSRDVVAAPPPDSAVPLHSARPSADRPDSLAPYAGFVAGASLLACLIVGPAFAVRARREEHTLALVAAQGADSRTLRGIVLCGALAVGVVGGAVGAALGVAGAWAVAAVLRSRGDAQYPELVLPPGDAALLLGLGVLVSLVAALPPALRAGRTDPAAVLAERPSDPRGRGWGRAVLSALLLLSGTLLVGGGFVLPRADLFVPGAVASALGAVLWAPTGVGALTGAAGRLPLAWRLALRDAGRHRERTTAAVTVVASAVALLVAVAVTTASAVAFEGSEHHPRAATGSVLVHFPGPVGADDADDTASALTEHLPVRSPVTVLMAQTPLWVHPLPDPGQPCPDWAVWPPVSIRTEPVPDEVPLDSPDCAPMKQNGDQNRLSWWETEGGINPLVDDGTLVRALDLPGAEEAARALEAGRVVVTRDLDLWSDGNARVEFAWMREGDVPDGPGTGYEGRVLEVPATAVDWPSAQYELIVPPALTREWDLGATAVGMVGPVSRAPSESEADRARAAVREAAGADLSVESPYSSPRTRQMALMLGLAAVVATGACLVSVRLAAADSRRDAVVLVTVGADPGTGRRLGAAQSGVVAAVGVVWGAAAGVCVGAARVAAETYRAGFANPTWPLVVPWPLLAACLAGVLGASVLLALVLTPAGLPFDRRAYRPHPARTTTPSNEDGVPRKVATTTRSHDDRV